MSALPASRTAPAPHHLLIPFAVCNSDHWLPAMKALPEGSTRQLHQLLQGMKEVHNDVQDAQTLSPPHERALARALGLAHAETPDGLIPWAAKDAAERLRADSSRGWAWITPCHWAMGREHAILTDPAALALREEESRALLAAMQPYFETDGITLHYAQELGPERWLAEGELFRTLPSASLDRVLGSNVDPWLPSEKDDVKGGAAGKMRLLQNEMQMLLYTHPLNEVRVARRQLPVNSFWLSGTGALATAAAQAPDGEISMPRSLAQAVFNDDWAAYAQAWAALDAGDIAALLARQRAGERVQLTLCGERGARTFDSSQASLWARISNLLAPKPLWNELGKL
ncbi:hypothetical protein [Polaromonas jejuensis]|uniref:Phosphoglycerate mutase n=1 Tax=Polaromonas jejuensis TaxID=457502 RepID=A0ABW0QDJ0_9BURK|nr:hypothetical protein [Polaromonas jejuensis]